jgi:hypothetical protein
MFVMELQNFFYARYVWIFRWISGLKGLSKKANSKSLKSKVHLATTIYRPICDMDIYLQ